MNLSGLSAFPFFLLLLPFLLHLPLILLSLPALPSSLHYLILLLLHNPSSSSCPSVFSSSSFPCCSAYSTSASSSIHHSSPLLLLLPTWFLAHVGQCCLTPSFVMVVVRHRKKSIERIKRGMKVTDSTHKGNARKRVVITLNLIVNCVKN